MRKWTSEQILALAPDVNSIKAAKELATARKWITLGNNQQSVWGECQGSGKKPYQTRIDLTAPAFKCSCPSRKFPCKHALALFLLFADQPKLFSKTSPPDWVSEWLTKRTQTEAKSKSKKEDTPANKAAQAKRAKQRENRVGKGIDDLNLWLNDLIRNGLDHVQSQPVSFWETPAANMVNAQAPGLARKLREMASIPDSGNDWQIRLLNEVSKLSLLIQGYQNIDNLPSDTAEDIRTEIGWTHNQDELLEKSSISDHWIILGKRIEDEILGTLSKSSYIKVQRTWLWGKKSNRPALILQFAAPGQTLDLSLVPGTGMDAEIVFFPSAFPLRALVKKHNSGFTQERNHPGFESILDANHAHTEALSKQPWISTFPLSLKNVIPNQHQDQWGLQDKNNHWLPIQNNYKHIWTLLSLSGGHPIQVFSEWNGNTLFPLSVSVDNRYIPLQTQADGG